MHTERFLWVFLWQKGQERAFELGKYLRNRYNGYLGESYSFDEVFVQSSSRDRTIMTAELCLAGLFPVPVLGSSQSGWQPIPVHSISSRVDNVKKTFLRFWISARRHSCTCTCASAIWDTYNNVIITFLQKKLGLDQSCPKHKKLYQEYLRSPHMTDIDEMSREIYNFFSQQSGLNITNYKSLYNLCDSLFVEVSLINTYCILCGLQLFRPFTT